MIWTGVRKACVQVWPNPLLEPTGVGKPLIAAQLQR